MSDRPAGRSCCLVFAASILCWLLLVGPVAYLILR